MLYPPIVVEGGLLLILILKFISYQCCLTTIRKTTISINLAFFFIRETCLSQRMHVWNEFIRCRVYTPYSYLKRPSNKIKVVVGFRLFLIIETKRSEWSYIYENYFNWITSITCIKDKCERNLSFVSFPVWLLLKKWLYRIVNFKGKICSQSDAYPGVLNFRVPYRF